jgi:hypothetical protein
VIAILRADVILVMFNDDSSARENSRLDIRLVALEAIRHAWEHAL